MGKLDSSDFFAVSLLVLSRLHLSPFLHFAFSNPFRDVTDNLFLSPYACVNGSFDNFCFRDIPLVSLTLALALGEGRSRIIKPQTHVHKKNTTPICDFRSRLLGLRCYLYDHKSR